MLIWIAIICGIVFLDQLTKWLITLNIGVGGSVEIIEGVIRFNYVTNEGMAFGLLNQHRWVFMVASTVAIIGVFVYMCLKHKQSDRMLMVALSMFVGGGIGNMIDRVLLGYVVDFVDFYAFGLIWRWVFNVADAFVCIGGGLLIVYFVMELIKETKKKKELDTNAETIEEKIGELDSGDNASYEKSEIKEKTENAEENASDGNG